MEMRNSRQGHEGALLESTPAHRGLPDTNDSRPVSGLARVMNASPSHARGAQWRFDAVARLPLRGQRRTSTDFPFHLTRGGVRHLKRGGYDHPHPLKSRRWGNCGRHFGADLSVGWTTRSLSTVTTPHLDYPQV